MPLILVFVGFFALVFFIVFIFIAGAYKELLFLLQPYKESIIYKTISNTKGKFLKVAITLFCLLVLYLMLLRYFFADSLNNNIQIAPKSFGLGVCISLVVLIAVISNVLVRIFVYLLVSHKKNLKVEEKQIIAQAVQNNLKQDYFRLSVFFLALLVVISWNFLSKA